MDRQRQSGEREKPPRSEFDPRYAVLGAFVGLGAILFTVGYFFGNGATFREVLIFWAVAGGIFLAGYLKSSDT